MCCPPKMIILQYTRKNSPLEKHNDIKVDGIKQGEMNNKITVHNTFTISLQQVNQYQTQKL
jgi:hypothetical protein